ncbi:uncharacterized protein LOC109718864 [Ananas comosus]|uniref:Uncharacterized protein LOC109718864 n=1 Tax=Ananas comosus TaxID=4615 RepID=A0A6P5FZ96_ANACO|nr:uncharacterized protein LOC109718864 [Ananas comosus]
MRLLAEWVSCGWRAARPEEAASERRGPQEKERPSPGEGVVRRRRRRRAAAYGGGGGGGGGAADPWRPSLGDIYEENAATEAAPLADAAAAAAGPATKLISAGSSGRVSPRARTGEFRQLEVTTISPAFTPTAFLF